MTDSLRPVEEALLALRRRGEACPPGPPSDFPAVQERMRQIRRGRVVRRAAVGGAALALAAGIAALVVTFGGVDGSGARPPGLAPRPTSLAQVERQPAVQPALTRLEPFTDLVVFADAATRISFPSTERVVLDAGTAALQLRAAAAARRLTVETPSARVVVTGTVLSVSVEPAGTGVEVLRGHVERIAGRETLELDERQFVRAGSVTVEALPAERVARLSALFPDDSSATTLAAAGPSSSPSAMVPPLVLPAPPVDDHAARPTELPPATQPSADSSLDEVYRSAEVAMREGRSAEAAELLRRVLARVPSGSSREETALIDLAQACEQLDDSSCGRDAFVRYLDRHPSGAMREDARLGLCRLLERSGPPTALRSCLEAYLAEFPDARKAAWAREVLGGLQERAASDPGNGG
jgi:hypothetical protein